MEQCAEIAEHNSNTPLFQSDSVPKIDTAFLMFIGMIKYI